MHKMESSQPIPAGDRRPKHDSHYTSPLNPLEIPSAGNDGDEVDRYGDWAGECM